MQLVATNSQTHLNQTCGLQRRSVARYAVHRRSAMTTMAAATAGVKLSECGSYTVQGTSRKQNEDRLFVDVAAAETPAPTLAVFDGHGGNACADWLSTGAFAFYLSKYFDVSSPERTITTTFLEADKRIIEPKKGFMGMPGERGIGGSKCGSTAATCIFLSETKVLTANVGDARVLLVRDGKAIQLTEDHVPDSEAERKRIEATNPNPNMPLVRFIGDTWRVGGLLALSRAFGDAYLKGTGQFEGVSAGSDGYSSGFGVIAEPYTTITDLTDKDEFLVLSSDGLYANEERGGGGGLSNDEVASMCRKMSKKSCFEIAEELATVAVNKGTTDDVTVIVVKLR